MYSQMIFDIVMSEMVLRGLILNGMVFLKCFSCVDVCICVVYSSPVGVCDPVYVHISIVSLSSVLVG